MESAFERAADGEFVVAWVEASSGLGKTALVERFQQRLARRGAASNELEVLLQTYLLHVREFTQNPEEARKLIAVGDLPVPEDMKPDELATWTMLANLVMNLDEFLNK